MAELIGCSVAWLVLARPLASGGTLGFLQLRPGWTRRPPGTPDVSGRILWWHPSSGISAGRVTFTIQRGRYGGNGGVKPASYQSGIKKKLILCSGGNAERNADKERC